MSTKKVTYTLGLNDRGFTGKLKSAVSQTSRLDNSVSRLQGSFSRLGASLGVGLGVYELAQFGRSTVEALKNYEYFSTSLRVLMKGDVNAAKAMQGQLIEFAKITPFSLLDVQTGATQLLATGSAYKDITKELNMLGNAASAVNVPLDRIILNYGQVRAQGVLMGTELRDFTRAGIPLISELAKNLGVAEGAIKDMVSEGKVGFKDVERAFMTMSSEGGAFFGLMEEQSKTVGGEIEKLGDSWEQLQVQIGRSQTGIIKGTISMASEIVGAFEEVFKSQNEMAEAFSKYGASQIGFFEKHITGRDVEVGLLKEMARIETVINNATNMGGKALEGTIKLFEAEKLALGKALNAGTITATEYSRRRALLLGGIDTLKGTIGMGGTNKGDSSSSMQEEKVKKGSSLTSIEARRPQNFNISIDSLIEEVNVNQQNMKDSAQDIKAELTRALTEALNDFQLVAGR